MANSYDFRGKVVVVTGSSSGIGEGVATYLASLGAKVIISGRNSSRLKAVAEKCQSSSLNGEVLSLVADVNNESDLRMLVDEVIKKFGRLDTLVNNAGIYQVGSILDDDYMVNYQQIMDTNLKSVILLTRLALPHLIASKGNIVNVSSVASMKPGATNSIYAMSKCAIDMFTKCLAIEYSPKGVRVNAINPAAIRTPIFDKVKVDNNLRTDKMAEIVSKTYPLGRIGETIDCAKAIAFLASNDASFLTGVTLLVDGGSLHSQLILPNNN